MTGRFEHATVHPTSKCPGARLTRARGVANPQEKEIAVGNGTDTSAVPPVSEAGCDECARLENRVAAMARQLAAFRTMAAMIGGTIDATTAIDDEEKAASGLRLRSLSQRGVAPPSGRAERR